MYNYTKVNNEIVAKVGIKAAYVYAKLHYRMNLSNKHKHYHDKHGHFIIYKIKDLMKDCHMGRHSVINALKKLEKNGLISKIHTIFANRLYLPKFGSDTSTSQSETHENHETELPKEHKTKNKDNKSVCGSFVNTKAQNQFPTLTEINRGYGHKLVRYAVGIYRNVRDCKRISNPYHFIVGILRRWRRKGVRTLNDAMLSENDPKAHVAGPPIPIFKL